MSASMETGFVMSSKMTKIQIQLFWFIYSLHIKNIISPDIVMDCLECIKDISFIDSFFSSGSSMKNKYRQYMESGHFPFQRHIKHIATTL